MQEGTDDAAAFSWDVFISYAHDDDNRLVDESVGWVSQFHENFATLLNEQLGRKPRIWRDRDLRENEAFDRKITNRLAASATFVPVLSKIFLNRPYCMQELDTFVKTAHEKLATYADGHAGEKKRLFVVEKLQVEWARLPEELQTLSGTFKFYREGDQTLRPMLTSKESADREKYYTVLNRLSKAVADVLKLIDGAAGATGSGLAVYVAETTSDLEDKREALCDDLLDRGYTVLPDVQLPRQVRKYSDVVRDSIARAAMSVHLIGREYGFIPEGENELSNLRLQHQLALEQGDRDPSFSQLVWLAANTEDVADDRQRRFIEHLQNDEAANARADLLVGDIEDVKTELYDKLAKLAAQQAKARESAPTPAASTDASTADEGPPLVYIICDKQDRAAEQLKALKKHLFDQGCETKLSLDEGGEEEILAAHLDRLANCDAFIIYHGATSERWLDVQLADFRKHLRNRPQRVYGKAVFIAPPFTAAKEDLATHEAMIVRSGESFDAASLAPFMAQLPLARG